MNTVIGQSKYCTPHPLSHCLISLCISLFDFNSIIKKETWGHLKNEYILHQKSSLAIW